MLPDRLDSRNSLPQSASPELVTNTAKRVSRRGRLRLLGGLILSAAVASLLTGCAVSASGSEPTAPDGLAAKKGKPATPTVKSPNGGIIIPGQDDFDFPDTSERTLAAVLPRESQQARTCVGLHVLDFPEIPASPSTVTVYFVAFPDQAGGLEVHTRSSQYRDRVYVAFDKLGKFAQREVGMSLSVPYIVPELIILPKPLIGGYDNDVTKLMAAGLDKLSVENTGQTPTINSGKLLIWLINPNIPDYELYPYPGAWTIRYRAFGYSTVGSDILRPESLYFAENGLAHEVLFHGLLGIHAHSLDPMSIGYRAMPKTIPLLDRRLNNSDLQGLCQNPPQLTRRAVLPFIPSRYRSS